MLQWKFMSLLWRTELELRLSSWLESAEQWQGAQISMTKEICPKNSKIPKNQYQWQGVQISILKEICPKNLRLEDEEKCTPSCLCPVSRPPWAALLWHWRDINWVKRSRQGDLASVATPRWQPLLISRCNNTAFCKYQHLVHLSVWLIFIWWECAPL